MWREGRFIGSAVIGLLLLSGSASQGRPGGDSAPHGGFSIEEVIASREQAGLLPSSDAEIRCSLVVLVDAVGIDYATGEAFFRTMARHPRCRKQDHSVGHAWMILRGPVWVECGHTGEFGLDEPDLKDSLLGALKRNDPDPLACFWRPLTNGRFELGSGGHVPSAAVEFDLSPRQYEAIRKFIHDYDYRMFCVRDRVCTHFVTQAAALAGITLGHRVTINIPKQAHFDGRLINWWTDAKYSRLTYGSPDVLEKSLKKAVENGVGRNVLEKYKKQQTHL